MTGDDIHSSSRCKSQRARARIENALRSGAGELPRMISLEGRKTVIPNGDPSANPVWFHDLKCPSLNQPRRRLECDSGGNRNDVDYVINGKNGRSGRSGTSRNNVLRAALALRGFLPPA